MNGTEYEIDELLENLESDESDEADIERRRQRFRQPRTATGRSLYPQRPSTNYVTQVQLQTALARVGQQIQTNSKAVAAVNSRINTISSEQTRLSSALKKETEERKKELEAQKKNFNQTVQLLSILPLLSRPQTKTITTTANGLASGDKVVVDGSDTLTALLPLLLVGGLGGSGGLGSSSEGGMDNLLLPIVLIASQQR
jgi:hypothetical protein